MHKGFGLLARTVDLLSDMDGSTAVLHVTVPYIALVLIVGAAQLYSP